MDANAQTGERIDGEDEDIIGHHWTSLATGVMSQLTGNGRSAAVDLRREQHRLTIPNTFFDKRAGYDIHTQWCVRDRSHGSRLYILTRQPHRHRVSKVDPSAGPSSQAGFRLQHGGGHRQPQWPACLQPSFPDQNPKQQEFYGRNLPVEAARWAATQRFLRNLRQRREQPPTTPPRRWRGRSQMPSSMRHARNLSKEPQRWREQEWNETPQARAALNDALCASGGRHATPSNVACTQQNERILKAACKEMAAVVSLRR